VGIQFNSIQYKWCLVVKISIPGFISIAFQLVLSIRLNDIDIQYQLSLIVFFFIIIIDSQLNSISPRHLHNSMGIAHIHI
jgi:hypothetical protein